MTIVGTELVMEFGGASIPDGLRGGRGGGGPERDTELKVRKIIYKKKCLKQR